MSNRSRKSVAQPSALRSQLKEKTQKRRRIERDVVEKRSIAFTPYNDLLPDLSVVVRRLDELTLPARSVRKYNVDDVVGMAQSIQRFRFTVPILVGEDGEIVDGRLRYKAARMLNLEHVPCICIDHLRPIERKALGIAMHRMGQGREWDLEVLKETFEELIIEDISPELLGFDSEETDIIRLDDEPEAEKAVPEPIARTDRPPLTRPGDLWQLGRHRLLCGDACSSTSYSALLSNELAHMLLCDPPYNTKISGIVSTPHREFLQASGELSANAFRQFLLGYNHCCIDVLAPGAIALSFMDWRGLELLQQASREAGFEQLNLLVWVKDNAGMGSLWRSQHELILAAKKPGADHKNHVQMGKMGRWRSNCWFAPGANSPGSEAREMLGDHPTPKPVSLLADAILDVTDRDDIVLDCFGGSGSTLMAAEKTGRIARLIELDPIYCDVILHRWTESGGAEPVLLNPTDPMSDVDDATCQTTEARHAR